MSEHNDSDPVIFSYSASCNISFRGDRASDYTWGEWDEMTDEEREAARMEFIFSTLGVEVSEK